MILDPREDFLCEVALRSLVGRVIESPLGLVIEELCPSLTQALVAQKTERRKQRLHLTW